MPKLHENESLESLLPIQPRFKEHRRYAHGVILTFINFLILFATLVIAALSFRKLNGLSQFTDIAYQHHESTSVHEHAATTSDRRPSSEGWFPCGNSSKQAIENGCIFDLMLTTWLHPDCYWPEHYSAASEAANLTFFLDPHFKTPYNAASAGAWPQEFLYTDYDYHKLHCTYMWERQIMAWTLGKKIDTTSWNLAHSKHCVMTVLEKPMIGAAQLREDFADCGKPSW